MQHMEQWADFLDVVPFSTNNRVRESTGYSSYELMFGRKARLPIEAEALGESAKIDQILSNQKDRWDRDVDQFVEASSVVLMKIHKTAEGNICSAQKSMIKSYDNKLKRYSK